MKIIVSGAGIGGLTAALCFIQQGAEVTVLERAPELGDVGAGIQVPPNAMKVFENLGLDNELAKIAFRPEAIEARMGRSGLGLFNIPLADAAIARWGAPYLHIHRADYIAVLETALRKQAPSAIQLGAELVSYSQNETGVTALLVDGTEVTGDVLIGADGIHSPIRETMLGPQAPVFTGNVAWRAVVPIDKLGDLPPRPTACAWMGAGKTVRYLTCGAVSWPIWLRLWNAIITGESRSESWVERGTHEEALADFQGWHPTITRILSEATIIPYRWALFDRAPLQTWIDGRVALLGDAAHPMLPFMAQGAAMAVEDGFVLANELAKANDVRQGLYAYQQKRLKRTAVVQAGSRANAKTFHRRSLATQLATYGPMWLAGKIAPTVIHARQDWLYGHDVTR